MKVLLMEGFYDFATPFAAADYTMSHLNLPPQFRKNISYSTYDSGHMVCARADSLVKFHDDVAAFIGGQERAASSPIRNSTPHSLGASRSSPPSVVARMAHFSFVLRFS